ncbi:hypothetical protein AAHN93_12115 [Vandammella animalimorsus]|uniref:hypothetical protein n=1 Tax=Vandammella animalimorsus TaxID=2029117 RepID=UPI0031BB820A
MHKPLGWQGMECAQLFRRCQVLFLSPIAAHAARQSRTGFFALQVFVFSRTKAVIHKPVSNLLLRLLFLKSFAVMVVRDRAANSEVGTGAPCEGMIFVPAGLWTDAA